MDLGYDRVGAGEPLVLIHGLGGTRRIWRPVIDRIAAEREVVAIDVPGFGDSPQLPAGVAPTAANLGAAVGDLCARLG
ncbi:MAG: alpha/beta fold hydrolase, partial [Solirubrobacterales bacterium]